MREHVIGVISDTHGLLRSEAMEALQGVEMILHGGDIGKPEVLEQLEKIAPVIVVRGNNDRDEWASDIPETRSINIVGVRVFVIHDIKSLNGNAGDHSVVVFGHSHKAVNETRGGVLHLNPGSAGPRRFRLPVTIARLTISDSHPAAEIIELKI